MRVKSYTSEFRAHTGEWVTIKCDFSKAQAAAVSAEIDDDGIPLWAARRLVCEWNKTRKIWAQEGHYRLCLETELSEQVALTA